MFRDFEPYVENMLRVRWDKHCHECGNPIGVTLNIESFRSFFLLRNFATHKPFCIVGNYPMIKYYGNMKLRRVCFACYFSPRNHLNFLKQREIGRVRKQDRLRSKTAEEIHEWFEDFDRYRKRNDIDDCLMPELGVIPGLSIYLLGTLYSNEDGDPGQND